MELHLPIFITSLILFVGVLSASTTSDETYWRQVLANTPMPASLKSSLPSISNHGKASPFRATGVLSTSLQVYTRGRCGPPHLSPSQARIEFMLETQLVPGRTTEVPLTNSEAEYKAAFLPRKESDSIPFSSDKLPEILDRFSVRPKSKEATAMENTIRNCEYAKDGVTYDKAYCATSLQGMVSFVKSELIGDDERVNAFSSPPARKTTMSSTNDQYEISGVKLLSDYGTIVSCHKQDYPYAVYYCHVAKNAAPYMVSLTSTNGKDAREKLVACHKDTSWWDPAHVAFQVLKVKPGATVCHFLSDLTVVWTHKY